MSDLTTENEKTKPMLDFSKDKFHSHKKRTSDNRYSYCIYLKVVDLLPKHVKHPKPTAH